MTAETIVQNLAYPVIARSAATKQSIPCLRGQMDCFAEPVIGRRFAPTRWLAMTEPCADASGLERHS
jgi:hypothetical protein